jgi:FMN-dependent NADH-azoreductase
LNDSIGGSEHTTASRKAIRKVLRIDSSAQRESSVTRTIGDEVIRRLAVGSPVDIASGYLRQVLRCVGIEDVRLIGAEGVASDAELTHKKALSALDEWLPDPVVQVA